jgi:hypothetical protein
MDPDPQHWRLLLGFGSDQSLLQGEEVLIFQIWFSQMKNFKIPKALSQLDPALQGIIATSLKKIIVFQQYFS